MIRPEDGGKMRTTTLGIVIFCLGILIACYTTVLGFIWLLVGLPAPGAQTELTVTAAVLGGFITPFGALLMVIGGLVYGKKERR
jgi:hypothetical protein